MLTFIIAIKIMSVVTSKCTGDEEYISNCLTLHFNSTGDAGVHQPSTMGSYTFLPCVSVNGSPVYKHAYHEYYLWYKAHTPNRYWEVTSKDPRDSGIVIPSKLRNYDCDRCAHESTMKQCPLPVRDHCDPSGWFYLDEEDEEYHYEIENFNDDWRTFNVECQECADSSPPSSCGWSTCEEIVQLNVTLPCQHTWRDLAQMFGGDESCNYDRLVSDVCLESCQQCSSGTPNGKFSLHFFELIVLAFSHRTIK